MKLRFLISFGLVLLAAASCSDADDLVSTAPECSDVCNRYQECFDDDFDVAGCIHDCADAAIDDVDYQERVETCAECLDRSCRSSFICTPVCSGIVPDGPFDIEIP